MRLTVLSDFGQLALLQDEWRAFALAQETLSPFQMPEWLLTWWRHFGGGELRALIFRENDKLVGIVPTFLHDWQGRRQLTLVGAGLSDYLDPVIDASMADQIVDGVRAYLQHEPEWEVCSCQDLSADTPFRKLASSRFFETRITNDIPCSEITISGSFDEYWNSRSKSLRQNVRRDRARLEASGEVRFAAVTEPGERDIQELMLMHTARWKQAGCPGMVAANASENFFPEVIRNLVSAGRVLLFRLTLDERPVALNLAFRLHETIFTYLTAFDPEYEAWGAGRALLYDTIKFTFETSMKHWDFLRGDEPYKTWWGAKALPKIRIELKRRR